MPATNSTDATTHISILLTHQFSMLSFSSLIAPLNMANQLSGRPLYRWSTVHSCAAPVTAANGIHITPDSTSDHLDTADALIVCGGDQIPQKGTLAYVDCLQNAAKTMAIGATGSGTYLLARAGLLEGYRCTIHWEHIATTRERFPGITITPGLFEIDRDRYTCAGGKASLDMMLQQISESHGPELTAAITEQLICDRQRDAKDSQGTLFNKSVYRAQPKLAEVVALMEANIEEPMTVTDLSHYTGLSKRQLERMFRKYLQCVPSRYYMQLRLEKARQLLLKTSKPVANVASECGFVSLPHFSKSYREKYGLPPREDRVKIQPVQMHVA